MTELHSEVDGHFPHHHPDPSKPENLRDLINAMSQTDAELGLAFDGDGDRCGVVDNQGNEIFADKIGVMLARDLSSIYKNAQFVVDVKSTGLFMTDPVLQAQGATAAGIIVALDRQERGATGELSAIQEIIQQHHIPVVSIIKLDHIVEFLREKGGQHELVESMGQYRAKYGAKDLTNWGSEV